MRGLLIALVAALVVAAPAQALTSTQTRDRAVIASVFHQHEAQADCIALHESSWLPNLISGTGDYGLFQINFTAWHGRVVSHYRYVDGRVAQSVWMRLPASTARFKALTFRPLANARIAWAISKGGAAWGPWSSFTVHGACH